MIGIRISVNKSSGEYWGGKGVRWGGDRKRDRGDREIETERLENETEIPMPGWHSGRAFACF